MLQCALRFASLDGDLGQLSIGMLHRGWHGFDGTERAKHCYPDLLGSSGLFFHAGCRRQRINRILQARYLIGGHAEVVNQLLAENSVTHALPDDCTLHQRPVERLNSGRDGIDSLNLLDIGNGAQSALCGPCKRTVTGCELIGRRDGCLRGLHISADRIIHRVHRVSQGFGALTRAHHGIHYQR